MNNLEKMLKNANISYQKDVNFAKYCLFKAGGKVKYHFAPNNDDEIITIQNIFQKCKKRLIYWGNGSNMMIKSSIFDGGVITSENMPRFIKMKGNLIEVSSNTNLFTLHTFLRQNGLEGLEFSFGIPAMVGGAVKMNAGAYGHNIGDYVFCIKIAKNNEKITLFKENLAFSYRNSPIDGYILSVTFDLKKSSPNRVEKMQNAYLKKRKSSQPTKPSLGSTFKRNGIIIPSKLIDNLGLKGLRVGDAQISQKHAGFIVNCGNATAQEYYCLMKQVQSLIKQSYCLNLEQEVILI